MKKFALIGLLLFISIFTVSLNVNASLGLYVGDQEVSLSQPVSIVNGNILVPLQVIVDYLGASITWAERGETVVIEFPDLTIHMRVGEESALVGEQIYRLDVPINFQQGDLMVPIRFFVDRLGLRLGFMQDPMAIQIDGPGLAISSPPREATQEDDEIPPPNGKVVDIHPPAEEQDLKEIAYIGGPRSQVYIDVSNYSGYQSMLLVNPDRLVVDLFGVNGEGLPNQNINGPIIQQIRTSLFDGNTIRVVFDLNAPTGYEIRPWPSGGLEVEFNYQLTEVNFTKSDDVPLLNLQVNDLPPWEYIYLTEPDRLVIDLQNTSLIGGAKERSFSEEAVRRLRVSQFVPAVTRIVLELEEPLTPYDIIEGDNYLDMLLFEGTPLEAEEYKQSLILAAEEQARQEQARREQERLAQEQLESSAESSHEHSGHEVPNGDQILLGKTIMIDPGHGGSDPGAIGHHGTFEKDINLAISLYLGEFLENAGADVYYTRETDVYVSIFQRPEMANLVEADILVSLHANAYLEQQNAGGTETLYNPRSQRSLSLAQAIQTALVNELQLNDRGLRQRTDLAVLNGATMPTALVEVAFINHPDEEVLLRAPGFQEAAARGIFQGIAQYFKQIDN